MQIARAIPLAAAIAALPGLAIAWQSINRNEVVQVTSTEFEVIGRVATGAADYWCSAGDFVIAGLGRSSSSRVYIWKAIGPSTVAANAKAVTFSLNEPPSGPAPQSYSLSVKAVGDSMSAAAAQQYCYGRRILDF